MDAPYKTVARLPIHIRFTLCRVAGYKQRRKFLNGLKSVIVVIKEICPDFNSSRAWNVLGWMRVDGGGREGGMWEVQR